MRVGLFSAAQVVAMQKLIEEFRAIAPSKSAVQWGCDGAYSNEKLYAYEDGNAKGKTPISKTNCYNHGTHKIEDVAKKVVSFDAEKVLPSFWSLCAFFRFSTYYIRGLCSTFMILDRITDIIIGDPDPADVLIAKEFQRFARRQLRFRKSRTGKLSPMQRRFRALSHLELEEAWTESTTVFNGPQCTPDGRIKSFVPSPVDRPLLGNTIFILFVCCLGPGFRGGAISRPGPGRISVPGSNGWAGDNIGITPGPLDRPTHIRRMAKAYNRTRLRTMPFKPEDGKWEKGSPVCELGDVSQFPEQHTP